MNNTKKVGRPRKFDEDVALQAAVQVFWAKGYDGASIKDLATEMGLNAPSLYATFGDKETLFLRTIKHYTDHKNCAPLVAFETETDLSQAVRAFLEAVVQSALGADGGARGCYLGSCVSTAAGNIEGVDHLLQTAITQTIARLAERFEQEKARGYLPPDFPSAARARLLFDLRQGYVHRARAGFSPAVLTRDLADDVGAVLRS